MPSIITPNPETVLGQLNYQYELQTTIQTVLEQIDEGSDPEEAVETATIELTHLLMESLRESSPAAAVATLEAIDQYCPSATDHALENVEDAENWGELAYRMAYSALHKTTRQDLRTETGMNVVQALALEDRIDSIYARAKAHPEFNENTSRVYQKAIEETLDELQSDVLYKASTVELARGFVLLQQQYSFESKFMMEEARTAGTWEDCLENAFSDALTQLFWSKIRNATGLEL